MSNSALTIGAYYYPGWHSCPVRDAGFPAGWREWGLVLDAEPHFSGHVQPNLPLWGPQDDSLPGTFRTKLAAAATFGVDVFVFAFYWSRGKRLLQGALDRGFLGCPGNESQRFACMWANRMPRRVMPVKDPEAQLIDPQRLVHTDPDDFLHFVQYLAKNYFHRSNYFRYRGGLYLSIFDTNFFLRQLGPELAKQAIASVRDWLNKKGFGRLHLVAIDPIPLFQPHLKEIGFDSVTHYVLLPQWKGDYRQDYSVMARQRAAEWDTHAAAAGLPYAPVVAAGWDATPRAADYDTSRKQRYPWSPIVVGRSPEAFKQALGRAVNHAECHSPESPLCMIASWNEWSEGHYLEPDRRYGYAWLQAVANARG